MLVCYQKKYVVCLIEKGIGSAVLAFRLIEQWEGS